MHRTQPITKGQIFFCKCYKGDMVNSSYFNHSLSAAACNITGAKLLHNPLYHRTKIGERSEELSSDHMMRIGKTMHRLQTFIISGHDGGVEV